MILGYGTIPWPKGTIPWFQGLALKDHITWNQGELIARIFICQAKAKPIHITDFLQIVIFWGSYVTPPTEFREGGGVGGLSKNLVLGWLFCVWGINLPTLSQLISFNNSEVNTEENPNSTSYLLFEDQFPSTMFLMDPAWNSRPLSHPKRFSQSQITYT